MVIYRIEGMLVELPSTLEKLYRNEPLNDDERESLVEDYICMHQRVLELEELNIVDELTGILNRRGIETKVGLALGNISKAPERYEDDVYLAFTDCWNFKSANDDPCYGHIAGDKILKRTASFLRRNIRSGDEIGRFGGDEFLMLLHKVGEPNQLLAKLDHVVGSYQDHMRDIDPEGYVHLNVGLACLDPRLGLAENISRADAAMYRSKEEQRDNGVCRARLYEDSIVAELKDAF